MENQKRSSYSYTSASQNEDRLLWESIRKGNELAFSSIYRKYVQPLFNYGMHLHSDRDLIKDCIQDLFAQVWTKRETLSAVDRVAFYLFRSFRNMLFHRLEQAARLTPISAIDLDRTVAELSPEWIRIRQESDQTWKQTIDHAIAQLTPRQREVVILRFFHSLEPREIAQVMQLSPAGVHNLISKTLKTLRAQIKWSGILSLALAVAGYLIF